MSKTEQNKIQPVIKWAGGKRQLVATLKEEMPKTFNTYHEPFFGGGALFCELHPHPAIINDTNGQLINLYRQIAVNPEALCEELDVLQAKYNAESEMSKKDELFYNTRSRFNEALTNNESSVKSAAILIFLNKVGFNGVYRVNRAGLYNVPSSHKKTVNCYDKKNIIALSALLKNTQILCGDFEEACKEAKSGDFVFFDSPYYDTFDTYQAGGFSEDDHVRLFNCFKALSEKGVYCMATNNACGFITELYRGFQIKEVDVKRMINRDKNNRKGKEVIIKNY